MTARAGKLIYWLALSIALGFGAFAALTFYDWYTQGFDSGSTRLLFIQAAAVGFVSWLIGRVALYVLVRR
jgi:hypothetical protein